MAKYKAEQLVIQENNELLTRRLTHLNVQHWFCRTNKINLNHMNQVYKKAYYFHLKNINNNIVFTILH